MSNAVVEKINAMAKEWDVVKGYIPPLKGFFATFLKVAHNLSEDEKILYILGIPFHLERSICRDADEENICAALRVFRIIDEGGQEKKEMLCEMFFLKGWLIFDLKENRWYKMDDKDQDTPRIRQHITTAIANYVAEIKEFPLD